MARADHYLNTVGQKKTKQIFLALGGHNCTFCALLIIAVRHLFQKSLKGLSEWMEVTQWEAVSVSCCSHGIFLFRFYLGSWLSVFMAETLRNGVGLVLSTTGPPPMDPYSHWDNILRPHEFQCLCRWFFCFPRHSLTVCKGSLYFLLIITMIFFLTSCLGENFQTIWNGTDSRCVCLTLHLERLSVVGVMVSADLRLEPWIRLGKDLSILDLLLLLALWC